ncbi:MAG: 2'-5' RNA ligase family protein [Bacteroidetes bacterium]|nr:2'-5' RNA ligase family protein [Bacteroidota bacterium]
MSVITTQASLFTAPVPAVYEDYLMVINPDIKVTSDVNYSKKKAAEILGSYAGKHSIPHISLASFSGNPLKEDLLVNEIRYHIMGRLKASFIWLEDYGCFPTSGTVYIKPKPKEYFESVLRTIYPALAVCSAVNKGRKLILYKEPHITIARGMNREKTNKLWDTFKDKKYENKFIADTLTLLRRDSANDLYKVVAEFKL